MTRLSLCCVVALAACTKPKPAPTTPRDPSTDTATTTTTTATTGSETQTTKPGPTPTAQGPGAHCLYVEPENRVVRCYWEKARCEEQLAFNAKLVAGQKCKAVPEAYCFDETGQGESCYPTSADCETTVAKFKKRNRPVSACVVFRGPH